MSQTKLTLQQKRSMADKCVSELEKKGIIHRIGKLITASHHLAKAANMVFTEAQDTICMYGFNRHMLNRMLSDYEKLIDRIGREFTRTYISQDPDAQEFMLRDFSVLFPRIVRDMGIEHDISQLIEGMMADFETSFDTQAEGTTLCKKITFRVTPAVYNRLHKIADYYNIKFPDMMRQMARLWCERNHTRKTSNHELQQHQNTSQTSATNVTAIHREARSFF